MAMLERAPQRRCRHVVGQVNYFDGKHYCDRCGYPRESLFFREVAFPVLMYLVACVLVMGLVVWLM
jgi:hypothetical protein